MIWIHNMQQCHNLQQYPAESEPRPTASEPRPAASEPRPAAGHLTPAAALEDHSTGQRPPLS